LKPWQSLGNVPNNFVLSRMALSPVDCLASISVKVAVAHSLPQHVRISLTRTGPASNDPRAKNHTATVVLKPYGGTIHIPWLRIPCLCINLTHIPPILHTPLDE
jgi:hypothetical protein